jgi:hypothetical protein
MLCMTHDTVSETRTAGGTAVVQPQWVGDPTVTTALPRPHTPPSGLYRSDATDQLGVGVADRLAPVHQQRGQGAWGHARTCA